MLSFETKGVSYSLAFVGYSLLLVRKKKNRIISTKNAKLIGIKKTLLCFLSLMSVVKTWFKEDSVL